MADDATAPATKQDITLIMEGMANYYQKMERKTEQWKEEMKGEMTQWKQEIIYEFHVVSEDIRHEALGANKDTIGVLSDRSEKHEKRIARLETHAGLIAA